MMINKAVKMVKQLLAGTILSPERYLVFPMMPAPFCMLGRGLGLGFLAECSDMPCD